MALRHRRANQAFEHPPCYVCKREYRGTAARPLWAFDRSGRLLGTVHTGCAEGAARSLRFWSASGEQDAESAQFFVWRHHIMMPPARPARGSSTQPSPEREAWESADNPNSLLTPPPARPETMAAYVQLVAQFREWQAKLLKGDA